MAAVTWRAAATDSLIAGPGPGPGAAAARAGFASGIQVAASGGAVARVGRAGPLPAAAQARFPLKFPGPAEARGRIDRPAGPGGQRARNAEGRVEATLMNLRAA